MNGGPKTAVFRIQLVILRTKIQIRLSCEPRPPLTV